MTSNPNIVVLVDKNIDFSSKVISGSKGQLKRRREKANLVTPLDKDFTNRLSQTPEPPKSQNLLDVEQNSVIYMKSDQNLANFEQGLFLRGNFFIIKLLQYYNNYINIFD